MWQEKETQGFIEIEQDYARLLKNSEGTIWTSETVEKALEVAWEACNPTN